METIDPSEIIYSITMQSVLAALEHGIGREETLTISVEDSCP